jgi:hypothetical protein
MTTSFLPGLELSRRYYRDAVQPVLTRRFPGLPHGAGRLGHGSEVLGFDTERSADHEWGPRLQLFVDEADASAKDAVSGVLADELPAVFCGYPTHFHAPDGRPVTCLEVCTVRDWFHGALGFDPLGHIASSDWLSIPTQRLAEVTGGAVFHDGPGRLTEARARLAWYPRDVWLFALASQWQRISQEEAFVGRAGEVGDDLGSALVTARLVRDLVRLGFLLERTWAPYGKWLGSAFRKLDIAHALGPELEEAMRARTWKDRESALCRAYAIAAGAQNRLGLCESIDPSPRPYRSRPFLVIHADRFAGALRSEIRDDALKARPPAGTVDQFVDSTDVLVHAERVRRVGGAL